MGFELGLRQWVVLGGLGIVGLAVVAVVVGLPLLALLDVSRRSPAQFAEAGEDRRTWLIAMLVATFVLGPGWIAALVYLRSVRPRFEDDDTATASVAG